MCLCELLVTFSPLSFDFSLPHFSQINSLEVLSRAVWFDYRFLFFILSILAEVPGLAVVPPASFEHKPPQLRGRDTLSLIFCGVSILFEYIGVSIYTQSFFLCSSSISTNFNRDLCLPPACRSIKLFGWWIVFFSWTPVYTSWCACLTLGRFGWPPLHSPEGEVLPLAKFSITTCTVLSNLCCN